MRKKLPIALATLLVFLFAPDAFATEGRTPGLFAVSNKGSAQYTIPIWAPPGPNGLQPHIALAYDSQSGNGPLGVGWYLSGLSTIYRCNLTYAQDSSAGAVTLTYSDRFCLDGNRLRLTSTGGLSTYGQNLTTYQTEIANFSNVTAHGATGNGPTYFTVQAKDGLTYEYGNGGNSQVLLNSTADTWLLDKVTDRAGNTMTIAYEPQSANLVGTTEPHLISWTPSAHGSGTYNYTMQFNHITTSTATSGYVAANSYLNATILDNVQISSAGAIVKTYILGYSPSATTARQTLVSMKECADVAQSNCLLQTIITYQPGTAGIASPTTSSGSGTTNSQLYSFDIDGDGRKDLIFATGTGSTSHWYVQFATGSGYAAPKDTTLISGQTDPVLFDDFLGKGKISILAPHGGVWTLYSWNTITLAFDVTPTTLALDSNRQPSTTNDYATADVNGDGLPDLVAVLNDSNIYTRLNTGLGTTLSFGAPTLTSTGGGLAGSMRIAGNNQFPSSSVQHIDVNGDGRDDIVYEGNINTNCHFVNGTYVCTPAPQFKVMYANGSGFTTGVTVSLGGSPTQFLPITFNDDACTDFIIPGSNAIYIAGCDGGAATTIAAPANIVAALDWDGDGRTDILANPSGTLNVYKSQGGALSGASATGIAPPSGTLVITDQNGDGLSDLAYAKSTASYAVYYGLHAGSGTPPDLVSKIKDGYGNSVSPTYVSIANSNYTQYTDASYSYQNYIGPLYVVSQAIFSDPSTQSSTYNQIFWYYGAWTSLQGRGFQSFYAKRMVDSRNGLYYFHYYERAFPYTGMDFEDVLSNNSAAHILVSIKTPASTASTTLDASANNQRYFPHFSNVTSTQQELGGPEDGDPITTSSTDFTYDSYGNAIHIVTTVTDNDPGSPPEYAGKAWKTDTTNTTDISVNPTTDLAAWCLNMLDQTQVVYSSTLAGSTSVTRTQQYTPDTPAACRIKAVITEPNSSLYKVTEALTFDSFGNISTDAVTGAHMPSSPASRLTTFNWGTTGQFPNSIVDPASATSTLTYTSQHSLTFGVPDSVKNANNLTTSWVYDDFGRKTKETRPDGTSTGWAWSACTSFCGWSNSVYQIAQTAYQTNGTTIRTDTTSYDSVDRITQATGPIVSNVSGTTETVQVTYNSLGLLAQKSIPFLNGATVYQQSYGYDALNRPVEAERPIGVSSGQTFCDPSMPPGPGCQGINYAYAGRKLTVTNPRGYVKTMITDVNGWLRKTTDAIGYTVTKSYDPAGSLIGITDSVGNTLLSGACSGGACYNYGLKPFLVSATDADLGASTYTIDSLGERTGWTDANGHTFSMTYDALSRPLTRIDPIATGDAGLLTQWQWGSTPGNHDVGQLIYECTVTGNPATCGASPDYSETRSFDLFGRPSTRSIHEANNPGNDPGGVYSFTNGYDTLTGLLKTVTYPITTSGTGTALTVQYGYQNGLLQSVTDTSDIPSVCGTTCTLWTKSVTSSAGQIINQETLGNGVVMRRTYDAVTSWLSGATAGVGGGAALLNQSYLEDRVGNVIQRQQNNTPGITESFAYDADDRLCNTLSSTCSTPTVVYDGGVAGPGNITSQTGVGTYTYPAAGQPRPHAVTSITGTFSGSYSYDANGNMTNRASPSPNIVWSTYNYPLSISSSDVTGNEVVQLTYGPDRQRWKQIYSAGGAPETTYYVGGLIDVVFLSSTTDYRQYIYAGSEPVAIYSRTAAGVNTMRYVLEDHQGGVSAITSNAGAPTVNESFSAWGTRRNPTTWSGAPSTADLNTIAGISRQGYTFQTALGQSMGLNHMNGRVEDAIIGRFLSPDPHIPDPTDAQSYNRYSYANNNPLTNTDPTGFCANMNIIRGQTDGGTCGAGPSTLGLIAGAIFGGGDGFDSLRNSGGDTAALTAWYKAATDVINTAINNFLNNSSTNITSTGGAQSNGASAQSQNGDGGAVGAFVAPSVGVEVGVEAATCPICVLIVGALFPSPVASDDVTIDSSQAYVFHFATDAKMAGIDAAGEITPNAILGVTWITPTPYPTAALAQSQLALPYTPNGFYAIPVQNLQTPVSWSIVQPNFGQPGGGVEGTTPVAIPITGAYWVSFPHN